jgi:hypothetical protein
MSKSPPPGLSSPQQALWWLKEGGFLLGTEWDRAHAICQQGEGTFAYDLVHALAHWIEGDISNRDYWYRRLDGWRKAHTIEEEWAQVDLFLRR